MAGRINPDLIAGVLDGDPLLTPAEAAAALGVDEMELWELTAAGKVPSIQPGGPRTHHRYRASDIDQFARFLAAARDAGHSCASPHCEHPDCGADA
jgi:excisionase family DNA binding protein